MNRDQYNRRNFLAALSSGAAGGLMIPFSAAGGDNSLLTYPESNSEFLFSPGMTYLNTGTLGPCRRETLEQTKRAWEELESMPLRYYGLSGAEEQAEWTRETAARFLGCDVGEMFVTNSTTNGMNSIAQGLRLQAGDRILTTDQEHGGGLLCWEYYMKYHGIAVDIISIPPGDITAESILNKFNDAITGKTKLISVSHVFSSTGLRMPIKEISALARQKGILTVVDGAQAAGGIRVNMRELGCDAYATSGHKWLMGPKGTGLMYLSARVRDIIRPMQFEEGNTTYSDSNGVVNTPGIVGLGKAIEYLESIGMDKVEEHNLALRNKLYQRVSGIGKLTLMSPKAGPLASPLLACRLPETIDRIAFCKMLFEKYKISIRPTHKQWFNGIRFSLHIFNTVQEVDFALGKVEKELA